MQRLVKKWREEASSQRRLAEDEWKQGLRTRPNNRRRDAELLERVANEAEEYLVLHGRIRYTEPMARKKKKDAEEKSFRVEQVFEASVVTYVHAVDAAAAVAAAEAHRTTRAALSADAAIHDPEAIRTTVTNEDGERVLEE